MSMSSYLVDNAGTVVEGTQKTDVRETARKLRKGNMLIRLSELKAGAPTKRVLRSMQVVQA